MTAALGLDSQGWAIGVPAAAWEAAAEADEARTGAGRGLASQGLFTGEKLMRMGPGWSVGGGLSRGVWMLGWSLSLQALAASLRMVDCGVRGASFACTRACVSWICDVSLGVLTETCQERGLWVLGWSLNFHALAAFLEEWLAARCQGLALPVHG